MMPTAHEQFVNALVCNIPGAGDAYRFNAEFRATILLIADVWMLLGPTLVEKAEKQQAEMERQVTLLREGRLL